MPAYVTSQGALEPFEADVERDTEQANETWTAQTRLYGTSLTCEPAIQDHSDPEDVSLSNGRSCKTDAGVARLAPVSEYGGLYIGYYLDQHIDWSLSGIGCPSLSNSHLFLALWGKSWEKNPNASVTALFCEPSYWTQDVNATLTVPSMNVSDVVPLGPRIPLTDNDFNRTAFEYVIGTGAQAVSERADVSESTSVINQNANLAQLGINSTTTNMIPFALGLTRLPPAQYADPQKLGSSLEQAHKLLHALALQQLMSQEVHSNDQRPGVVRGRSRAIVVIRPLTIAVEALLGLVILLTLALLINAHKRPSRLSKDPASLTDMMNLIAKNPKLSPLSSDQRLEEKSFKLGCDRLLGPRSETQSSNRNTNSRQEQTLEKPKEGPTITGTCQQVRGVRPIEMSLSVGIAFVSLLLLALITVVAMKVYADRHTGLPLPSYNELVNQIVLNYVPIIFASFVEPIWLLLNRLLCVLQPFETLRHGNARSSSTLDLKYTSLPPQLISWRAFRGRHYLLSAVCAIGLSANLLAVSLNGLLEIEGSQTQLSENVTRHYEPIFGNLHANFDVWDYLYVAKANFSDGVVLPPWTTPDRFFVPFALNATSQLGQIETFTAMTQGFGGKIECVKAEFNDTAYVTGQQDFFTVDQVTPSGRRVTCGTFLTPMGGQNNTHSALEVLNQLWPLDRGQPISVDRNRDFNATQEATMACNSVLLAGFLRANLSVSFNNTKTENTDRNPFPQIERINSLSSLWMTCRPNLATATYEVTVDRSGRVLSNTVRGPNAENLRRFFTNDTETTSLVTVATSIMTQGQDIRAYWHNDTYADNWFGYFIKRLSNSTTFVDPTQPVPSFEQMMPLVQDLYKRLFAIVLGLNQDWLIDADQGTTIPGILTTPCQRVFVSRPMFIITATLLALNIVVAMAYWAWRPKRLLPQMPYTIASVLDMFHGSGLIEEAENKEDWEAHWKFGYGRFVGTDGKPHVGIERRPFVIPLDT
ncbi:MAG: hypothetical protein Q9203_005698 [Teloschistes exilis]